MAKPIASRTAFAWFALVVAALLLRAAVPSGWMPVFDARGLTIVLCEGNGPVAPAPQQVDASHHAHHDENDDDSDTGHAGHEQGARDACPFGLALGKALDLPAPVGFDMPSAATYDVPALAALGMEIARARNLRPPATGPPALS